PATVRLALAGSIGWGVGIWYFGEGLGGIASGHALMLTGAPGAALLYIVLAVALWPKVVQGRNRKTVRTAAVAPWLPMAWAILWIVSALFNALPGQNTAAAMAQAVDGNADGAPGWLATIDHEVARGMHGLGIGVVVGLVAIQLLIGISGLARGWIRTASIWAGALLSLGFWAVGQSFGELYSGQATDPSTAVVVLLMGAAVLAAKREGPADVVIESRQPAGVRSFASLRRAA
ncbi:MAG: hypothetical protein ACRDV3_16280, partial [Acidothermaceae bacterium]